MTTYDVNEIKQWMLRIEEKVNKNSENIAKLTSQRGVAEMLIRWVVFPLVSILAAGFGIERVISG